MSAIPNDILNDINTKIILGIERANERKIIMHNSYQDLSEDDRTIASRSKGEAIVTSVFSRFAIPVKLLLFEELVRNESTGKS